MSVMSAHPKYKFIGVRYLVAGYSMEGIASKYSLIKFKIRSLFFYLEIITEWFATYDLCGTISR